MKHWRFLCTIIVLFLLGIPQMRAQDADLPLQHEGYHYIDRVDIKGLTGRTVHTDLKPYSRASVSAVMAAIDTSAMTLRDRRWLHLTRIAADDDYVDQLHARRPILRHLFTNGRDFYAYRDSSFRLYANPIVHINAGTEQINDGLGGATTRQTLYRNSRGVQVRGSLFNKVGFFSEFSENQAKLPSFVQRQYDSLGVLTGENFVKTFDATTPNPGYDFFSARGYVTYSPAKPIRLKFGKDRATFGNGYQSLQLSDNSADHFFLNIDTKIWKLEYVNHFAMMTDFLRNKLDTYGTHPKKYAVFHQLFYKPRPWLSVGLFESVVYSPTLPGGRRGFELEYMNPIIFYRSVEQSLGSPDNSTIGLSWKVNALKRFQQYGQLLIDDYNFRNRALGVGSWGNKYGYQVGLKYIDAFWIPRLDLQIEYNRVRPYTYAHFNPTAANTHYGQYIAYSLGANAYDLQLIARYQPYPRWTVYGSITRSFKGLDGNGINYGGNVARPYTIRYQDYNNFVGQGSPFQVTQAYGKISYRILGLDGYAELEGRYRKENDQQSMSILGALRFNFSDRLLKY
jgi:hypothetical protein